MTIQWFIVTSTIGMLLGVAAIYGVTLIAAYLHERSMSAARNKTVEDGYFANEDIIANLTLVQELRKEVHEELRPEITAVNKRLEGIESATTSLHSGNPEIATGTKQPKQRTGNHEVA